MKTWHLLGIFMACIVLAGCLLPWEKPQVQVTGAGADNWTDDGHGGVYWTMNNYTISAYPKTATSNGNDFLQYVNFTSTNPNPITANLSFVFDEAPSSGSISIWRNTTTRLNATYTIYGVINFTASNGTCSIGDNQNINKYLVFYNAGNGTRNEIACFDSYTQNGNDYTITYSYNNWVGWENILSQFHYTNVADHHIWTYNNVQFNGSTNYQTRFEYSFPQTILAVNGQTTQKLYNGKFDIYAHTGSPSDVVNGIGTIYVVLDPYYNSTQSGALTYDGNYTVVTFTSNGTFNVTGTINATVLVVAGGGGGGHFDAGGGAGGSVEYNTSYNATGSITVGVGLGGRGGFYNVTPNKGGNSIFGTITAYGGGYGGGGFSGTTFNPTSGGSGGGGGNDGAFITGANAGNGSNVFKGGNGLSSPTYNGAGGGGAGSIGINATSSTGGSGGQGYNTTINGSLFCVAGGGGGGVNTQGYTVGAGYCGGGYGGDKNVSNGGDGYNATQNTGSGGGGGGSYGNANANGNGGRGGSGIVIIRYLTYVTPPNLTINYTTGITTLQFRPIHAFATNVQPVNQSASVPLFNVTTGSAGTFLINASQTPAIAGFTVKCAPNYNQSGIVTLNATSQWIANVTYPSWQGIWCWGDFHNPTAGLKYNITVVQG